MRQSLAGRIVVWCLCIKHYSAKPAKSARRIMGAIWTKAALNPCAFDVPPQNVPVMVKLYSCNPRQFRLYSRRKRNFHFPSISLASYTFPPLSRIEICRLMSPSYLSSVQMTRTGSFAAQILVGRKHYISTPDKSVHFCLHCLFVPAAQYGH